MMGRLLSAAEIKHIAAQEQADLTMIAQHKARIPERLVEGDAVTNVYRSFDDVYGQPILTLRVDVPRQITLRGHSAVVYASAYLIGAAVVVLVLLVVILIAKTRLALWRVSSIAWSRAWSNRAGSSSISRFRRDLPS